MMAGNGRNDLTDAVASGLDYILSQQGEDGAWTDWSLPPGPAPHWTTAHVGRCLSALPGPHPPPLEQALRRAADWLHTHRLPGGAWGYNDRVDPDADTTSLAVLFLTAQDRETGQGPIEFLRRAQRPDGGFSTFLPDRLTGAWGRSHAEITAISLLALRSVPGGIEALCAKKGLAWLRRHRREDGTWAAYWWTTPYLATGLALSCLAAFGYGEDARFEVPWTIPGDTLQAAHLLSMTPQASPHREVLTEQLRRAQNPDGSWAGRAALRIPPRDCAAPWNEPSLNPVYSDPHRLFTTATVVSALADSGIQLN
jgi:squalene-hopene/tetraprenyl-beta-curcumene cyclase